MPALNLCYVLTVQSTPTEQQTPTPVPTVVALCRRLVGNVVFETVIVIVIVVNATMLGAGNVRHGHGRL